jgi:hypothetical protein
LHDCYIDAIFDLMKNLITFCLFILSSSIVIAQQMTLDQWNEEAKTNIRCLPKYGHVKKTAGQMEADSEFIQVTLPRFATKRLASEHLIDLGFKYLYQDVKTAMYRFNQAYLLDSTNSDIYWGYGGVYMILQDYPRAKEQYEGGLFERHRNKFGGLLLLPMDKNRSLNDFQKDIEKNYGSYAKELLEYYPASNDSEAAISQGKLSRDHYIGAENYTFANIETGNGKTVYVYRFTRRVPGTGQYAKYGAFHSGEVPYLFDNLKYVNRPWEPIDHQLANTMSTYWVNFVKSGDPNGKGLPEWTIYETRSKKIMDLGDYCAAKTIPDSSSLNFLYSILNAD